MVIIIRIEINKKPWDLVVIQVLVVLFLVVTLTTRGSLLRIVLGLPFLLFLPGYVITSALFPKAKGIESYERIILSFGSSIAIVSLIGLLLNYTPWGIGFYPILTSLFILIVSVSIIAWYRRSQIPVEDRFCIIISNGLFKGEELATFDKILTIIMAISIIIAISTFIYVITLPKEGERFTEFYILNENGTAENYPTNLTINENGIVIVGVVCREHKSTKYTIKIELINLIDERENMMLREYNLTLDHNQRNETIFNFNIINNGSYKLQFLLYINDNIELYRELHLWINVKS